MPFGIAAAVAGVAAAASVVGGIVKGIGAASAGSAESSAYNTAAGYASQEANITANSTATQEMLANRKITQALGTEQADTAGNGLAMSGSAAALMRSSIMQGGIQKSLIEQQGEVTQTGYEAQSAAYTSQAKVAASSGTTGAIGDILGGIASI